MESKSTEWRNGRAFRISDGRRYLMTDLPHVNNRREGGIVRQRISRDCVRVLLRSGVPALVGNIATGASYAIFGLGGRAEFVLQCLIHLGILQVDVL